MEQLLQLVKNCGASDAGAVPLSALASRMDSARLTRAGRELPGVASLICGVFPYFVDFSPGNIALYARGRDYHRVLEARLAHAAGHMAELRPGHRFKVYVDASPYPEVAAAALSGLGVIGQQGLLITPAAGSFVFVGIIATTLAFEGRPMARYCRGCGRCLRACPGGALSEAGLTPGRCLSHLSQLRGTLGAEQAALLASRGMAWGCDVCQKVCPMNRDMAATALPEFSQGLIRSLTPEDVALGDRAFRRRFEDRAFTWRGVQPLRRNLALIAGRGAQNQGMSD